MVMTDRNCRTKATLTTTNIKPTPLSCPRSWPRWSSQQQRAPIESRSTPLAGSNRGAGPGGRRSPAPRTWDGARMCEPAPPAGKQARAQYGYSTARLIEFWGVREGGVGGGHMHVAATEQAAKTHAPRARCGPGEWRSQAGDEDPRWPGHRPPRTLRLPDPHHLQPRHQHQHHLQPRHQQQLQHQHQRQRQLLRQPGIQRRWGQPSQRCRLRCPGCGLPPTAGACTGTGPCLGSCTGGAPPGPAAPAAPDGPPSPRTRRQGS